jgi:hypothetical protein
LVAAETEAERKRIARAVKRIVCFIETVLDCRAMGKFAGIIL